jgi:hypothetical protein
LALDSIDFEQKPTAVVGEEEEKVQGQTSTLPERAQMQARWLTEQVQMCKKIVPEEVAAVVSGKLRVLALEKALEQE